MSKIFLLLNKDDLYDYVSKVLLQNDFEIMSSDGEVEDILTQIHNFSPDIILTDNELQNAEMIVRQIKSDARNQNIQLLMLLDTEKNTDFISLADGIIELPLNDDVFNSTIQSHQKIKKSLDRLYKNNKELSKSLYQLNVLYNTSSQFAGTLNTNKLYDIMLEAMEKTLSYDISAVLIFNSEYQARLNLNTIHMPSENLVDAMKIRSILNYKSVVNDNLYINRFNANEIEVVQNVKQSRSNKIYGIEAISYDSLFAPIKVGDDFFGVIELFRQTPFTQEDVTCFQAITHQVALPLRSAKLYEDISITNKKLEKLEKIKSEFVSIVSHELRTPLTPINNSLEIVLSEQAGRITDETRNFVSMAKRNIQRLSGIIEDLLDLSRIQAGKMDFIYKVVDITSSLELLQKTFLQVANEKNIKINLEIKKQLPEIYADIRRIEQIFSNLVSNSIKFTPNDGEINVVADIVDVSEIDFEKLIMPKIDLIDKYIKISVIDNGIGIKKEDIPTIFDKFSQIESSLNRNKGGVGLGLTITKQLIDSHLGAIWVDSEEKQGSTFNVILPLLNDLNVFKMNLLRALTNDNNVGVLKIKYPKNNNLIEFLKEQKLLVLSKQCAEVSLEQENCMEYFALISKISVDSFDALYKTLLEFCSKIDTKECAIMLSKAHSQNNGVDIGHIFDLLNN